MSVPPTTRRMIASGTDSPPAVTLGMVIVNKGNNKITELRTIL